MNRYLSLTAMLGLTCSGALAQNIIDFHAEFEDAATEFMNDDPFLPDFTAQRHSIHVRIDTDAPPILDHPTLTRFGVEVISWEFWDSILGVYGFIDDTTPPFTSDGDPQLESAGLDDVSSLSAYLQVQDDFWTINLTGSLDINNGEPINIVSFKITVRDPYPDFAVGIGSLPDDPSLYAPSVYTGPSPLRITAEVADYIASAEWPPEPSSMTETVGNLAWSSMLYTEPQPECTADLNGDGVLDFFDVSVFISAFQMGCP